MAGHCRSCARACMSRLPDWRLRLKAASRLAGGWRGSRVRPATRHMTRGPAQLGLLAPGTSRPTGARCVGASAMGRHARCGLCDATAATLHPDDRALVDDSGTLSFGEVHRRTNALARGLHEAGVESGDRLAILCRNHAGFAEAILAASKLGADEGAPSRFRTSGPSWSCRYGAASAP